MAGNPCIRCDRPKSADVHSRHYRGEDAHGYTLDPADTALGMSEGVRNFRKTSGYDAAVKAAKGGPCQIMSPVCTGRAEHLHEPMPRGRAGNLERAVEIGGTIPACDACNDYCSGEGQIWAAEHGFLFRNTVEGVQAAQAAKEERESRSPAVSTTPARRPKSAAPQATGLPRPTSRRSGPRLGPKP